MKAISTPYTDVRGQRGSLGGTAAVAAAFMFAACVSDVAIETQPETTFSHKEPLVLAVGTIDVVSRYAPADAARHVEGEVPMAPAAALRSWARDRLKVGGGPGLARFVILDAAVIETDLSVTSGLLGMARDDQAEQYAATAEALLEVADPSGETLAFARSRATRTQTVPESTTLNEREAAMFEMTEVLMQDFDADMEVRIREHLGPWLK